MLVVSNNFTLCQAKLSDIEEFHYFFENIFVPIPWTNSCVVCFEKYENNLSKKEQTLYFTKAVYAVGMKTLASDYIRAKSLTVTKQTSVNGN